MRISISRMGSKTWRRDVTKKNRRRSVASRGGSGVLRRVGRVGCPSGKRVALLNHDPPGWQGSAANEQNQKGRIYGVALLLTQMSADGPELRRRRGAAKALSVTQLTACVKWGARKVELRGRFSYVGQPEPIFPQFLEQDDMTDKPRPPDLSQDSRPRADLDTRVDFGTPKFSSIFPLRQQTDFY